MLEKQELGVKIGECFEVIVTQVESVDKFWINRRSRECSGTLDELMECMDIFYNSRSGKNCLDPDVRPGIVMAAPYGSVGYHRVTIEYVNQDEVGVCYVDYGTRGVVKVSQLRSLPNTFTQLPAQAIECCLWGIKDTDGRSFKRFMELVNQGNRHGGFVSILKETKTASNENSNSLILVDTASNNLRNGIIVNDVLLSEDLVLSIEAYRNAYDSGLGVISEISSGTDCNTVSDESWLVAVDEELDSWQHVRLLSICDGTSIFVIRLHGETWVSSGDISSLIADWCGRDILTPMLARKKVILESQVISSSSHQELYDSMRLHGVPGVNGQDQIIVYKLSSIPSILNLFMVTKNKKIMLAFHNAVNQFSDLRYFWSNAS